jgi:hypothetical protein
MNISVIKNVAQQVAIKVSKNAPEILTVAGVIGVVAASVWACKSTYTDLDTIIAEKEYQDKILEDKVKNKQIVEEDAKKKKFEIRKEATTDLVKLYGPSVSLGVLSIASILYGQHVLKGRYVTLLGAYDGLEKAFHSYRNRVISEEGEEADKAYLTGMKVKDVEVVDEKTGEVTKKKELVNEKDPSNPNDYSIYAKIFDESSYWWKDDPELNKSFLITAQQYFNDRLRSRHHVFLNEVYEYLGLEETNNGCFVGWRDPKFYPGSTGDGYIDFGIFDLENKQKREFVNGYEPSIIVDFNVDGVIAGKIEKTFRTVKDPTKFCKRDA